MNIERIEFSNIQPEKKLVPDPLENIIEGGNRQERYRNFTVNVLGKIWPQEKNSGEYGSDFWRSTRWENGDIGGYTQSSPTGRDPISITPQEFENMVENIGPDYPRARIIPPELLKPTQIIPTGGSCAIETWGMRNMSDIQIGIKNGVLSKEVLANTARQIVDLAPTITHISGAMLSGQNASVHYVENDMWAERIASYGIPDQEAESLVNQAYIRIQKAVKRRAKLINPNTTVIPVNFDELGLKDAVPEWFNEIGTPYDPNYRLAEVAYTYDGPRQKKQVLAALQKQIQNGNLSPEHQKAARSLLDAEYHVRLKQIDHLRWESMRLPNEVITGKRKLTAEEENKYKNDYMYQMMTDALSDVYKRHTLGNTNVISVGFSDLPYYTGVQHETRNVGLSFKGSPDNPQTHTLFIESLKKSVDPNNPVRLHRLNINTHLSFLQAHFREKDYADQSKEVKDWMSIFPLSKNPFIIHSMQYLWDTDFNLFITEAVSVQTARSESSIERKEANQKMQILMANIYPKLESYTNYIYGRTIDF